MEIYLALIQLGQRQHQSERYWGYRPKKLRGQQDGQMEKHLRNFMIRPFKRTFQTIYLDEICCFYMNMRIWCYLYRKHIWG